LQLEQIAAAGNAAEKSLLADVMAKYPAALYIELLRLFKARYRMGTCSVRCICCMLHGVCCAFGAHICSQPPHRLRSRAATALRALQSPHSRFSQPFNGSVRMCVGLSGSALFRVCVGLVVCLVVCLLACDSPLQNTPSMARPTPHARRRALMAYSRFAARKCVAAVRALVRRHQPLRAAAPQRHCTSAYA
jgi:hypothetical protein